MNKIVRLGTQYRKSVFCRIKIKDGRLSITGVVGPRSGNAMAAGQIRGYKIENYDPDWSPEKVEQFYRTWERWHLNDLTPGTPKQMEYLRSLPGYPLDYDSAVEALKAVDLYEDDGYKYGSKWLREEIPESVIEYLESLPETKKEPAWV